MTKLIYIKYIILFIFKSPKGKVRKSFIFPIVGIFMGSYIIYMTFAIMDGMENHIYNRMNSFNYPYYIENLLNESIIDISLNNGFERIIV